MAALCLCIFRGDALAISSAYVQARRFGSSVLRAAPMHMLERGITDGGGT